MKSDKKFLIIDAHAHMGPVFSFYLPYNDAQGMLKTMDLLDIEATVVSSNAAISSDTEMGNRYTLEAVQKYPGRYLGQFVFNPHYPDQMKRDIPEYFAIDGFVGFKIHPEFHGDYPMTGKGYKHMWQYANENKIPVLSHTYFGGDRLEVFENIAKEYPDVPLIIGHGGLDLGVGKAIDMVNRQPNLYFDLCSPVSKKYGALKLVSKECNPDKPIFGTDSPWNAQNIVLGSVLFTEVDSSVKKKWFRDNFFKVYTRASKVLAP